MQWALNININYSFIECYVDLLLYNFLSNTPFFGVDFYKVDTRF